MRLTRATWLMLASLGVVACAHDDVVTVITEDGESVIPVIDLSTAGSGGAPTGTRATNRFIFAGFDTAIVDAFSRSSTLPALRGTDPNGFGYTSGSFSAQRLIFFPSGARNGLTDRYLPRLQSDSAAVTTFYGSAQPVGYIVQANHPFNGNLFWEFWVDLTRLSRSTRYIMGLVRYALDQRGALDHAEVLLNGTVTQADSLVFLPGDFNPAGYRSVTQYGAACPDPTGAYNAVAGANPHFVGSARASAGTGSMELDVTICRGTVWAKDSLARGTTGSILIPNGNQFISRNQYNFLVVWEANPDSTPIYAKPVLRVQIGPVHTTTDQVINNMYAPVPSAAFSQASLLAANGGVGRVDSVKFTGNGLLPLATGAYQLWVAKAGTDSNALVTGARVVRLLGTTVVDTLTNVSEFNVTAGVTNAARVEFDFGPYAAAGGYDQAVLAIAPTSGATTLSAAQPLWGSLKKLAGVAGATSVAASFGTFNKGLGPALWGPGGSGTGGIFGRELREDLKRLPRPAIGYLYRGWLINTTDATKRLDLGVLASPYPDLVPLIHADTMQSAPLAGGEITQAAIRVTPGSFGTYCTISSIDTVRSGTRIVSIDTTVASIYNRLQVRLEPKATPAGTFSSAVVLSGAVGLPPGANSNKSECQ